jgi:hypothetical protein
MGKTSPGEEIFPVNTSKKTIPNQNISNCNYNQRIKTKVPFLKTDGAHIVFALIT